MAIDIKIATAMEAENLEEVGATDPEAVKHNFQDLGGTGSVRMERNDEEGDST